MTETGGQRMMKSAFLTASSGVSKTASHQSSFRQAALVSGLLAQMTTFLASCFAFITLASDAPRSPGAIIVI